MQKGAIKWKHHVKRLDNKRLIKQNIKYEEGRTFKDRGKMTVKKVKG